MMLQIVSLIFFAAVGSAAAWLVVSMLADSMDDIARALGLRTAAFVPAPPPMRVRARIVRGPLPMSKSERMRAAA